MLTCADTYSALLQGGWAQPADQSSCGWAPSRESRRTSQTRGCRPPRKIHPGLWKNHQYYILGSYIWAHPENLSWADQCHLRQGSHQLVHLTIKYHYNPHCGFHNKICSRAPWACHHRGAGQQCEVGRLLPPSCSKGVWTPWNQTDG